MSEYFGSVLVPGVVSHFFFYDYTLGSKTRYKLSVFTGRVHVTGLQCREITRAHSNQNIYTAGVHGMGIPTGM